MDTLAAPMITHIPREGGMVTMGSDDLLIVRFYKKPIPNALKSKQAGHPVYDAVDYVYIQQPGERDTTDRPVHDGDKMRFARQWAQYERNAEQVPEGTPLSVLFVEPNECNIPPYLNGLGIYTVEQLNGLSATGIQNIGLGGQEWVNKAKKYLDYASKGKGYHHLDKKLTEQANTIDVQAQQIEALKKQVDQLLSERYGTTGHPNQRPQAHGSIADRRYQVPQVRPAEIPIPRPEPMEPDQELADVGLNPDTQPIPVFRDTGEPNPKRRGRPPGSKNKPRTQEQ